MPYFFFILVSLLLLPAAAFARGENTLGLATAGAGPAGSNLLNPNISVIGWFQGLAGRTNADLDENPAFRLHEAEIGFQSAVDPYSRADAFISVDDAGKVDLEEGYLTAVALPYGFQAKLGKFQPDLGKFNRMHTPETDFADRPLAAQRLFGEEPLKVVGGAVSHAIPNPWDLYLNFDAQVANTPDHAEVPAFAQANRGDLLYLGRVSGFADLGESANVNLGLSYANGANGFEINAVDGSSTTRRSQAGAVDLTFRWKNPRRSIYRSLLWQTEYYVVRKDQAPGAALNRGGAFTHLRWQFARRWYCGARLDWTQRFELDDAVETGGLAYLTFYPSEFSLISLQGKHVKFSDGSAEDIGFLKVTFNIGPHGAHPF